MRIACPSCKAVYEVPDSMLSGTARKVRCARCAFEWVPESPENSAPKPPALRARPEPRLERPPRTIAVRPLPSPLVDPAPPPSSRGRSRPMPLFAGMATLAVSVVVLAGLVGAAYTWRAELVLLWPPSQRLLAALGLG